MPPTLPPKTHPAPKPQAEGSMSRFAEIDQRILEVEHRLIAREEGSTVHDLENYRRTATAMMNKGKAVDATVKTQTTELPAKHYNQSDD